jgi:hypothetical protein
MSPIISTLANGSAYGYRTLAAAGGGPSYESIASATGTGSNTTITFSSIPSTFTALQVRFTITGTASGTDPYLYFNGDYGSPYNYTWHRLIGNGSTVTASGSVGDSGVRLIYGADTNATYPISGIIDVQQYASTTQNKTVRTFAGQDANGTFASPVGLTSGLWNNTNAITSLSLILAGGPAFATGTTIALYGIKGA